MLPIVSIITINYNNFNGLSKTFESIFNQTYKFFEYIVIDGGSSDGSKELIEKYSDQITYWVSEPDKGVYNAMNKGVLKAKGEYLLFLNSGDTFYNNESLISALDYLHNIDIIAFDIHVYGKGYNQINTHPDELRFSFLFEQTFAHQSVFIKRNLFDKVGLYDEDLKIVSDWKFFIHALTYFKATYLAVHIVLCSYNLDGISSTGEGTFVRKKERNSILNEDFYLFKVDYEKSIENNNLLQMNRYKMLCQLERNKIGRKIVSTILKLLTKIF